MKMNSLIFSLTSVFIFSLCLLCVQLKALPEALDELSIEEKQAFENACVELWGQEWEESIELSLLKGGLTDTSVFRIHRDGDDYVLRFFPRSISAEQRKSACEVMEKVAEAGVGPQIFYVSPESKLVVMEFLSGGTTHPEDFQDLENLRLLAQLIARMHSVTDCTPVIASNWGNSELLNWFEVKTQEQDAASVFVEAHSRAREILTLLDKFDLTMGLNHGDVHSLNLMRTGNALKLVDWDYSTYANIWGELARVSHWLLMDPEKEQYFLRQYFGRDLSDTEQSIFYMMKVFDYAIDIFGYPYWIKEFDFSEEACGAMYDEIDASFLKEVPVIHAEGRFDISSDIREKYTLACLKQFLLEIETDEFARHWNFLSSCSS